MIKSGMLLCIVLAACTGLLAQRTTPAALTKEAVALEQTIIDTIRNLDEVKKRAAYVQAQTAGKRKLQYIIWEKPHGKTSYYWIAVTEDNGDAYYTHFNFYLYPKSFHIKYLDPVSGDAITLAQWRKMK